MQEIPVQFNYNVEKCLLIIENLQFNVGCDWTLRLKYWGVDIQPPKYTIETWCSQSDIFKVMSGFLVIFCWVLIYFIKSAYYFVAIEIFI